MKDIRRTPRLQSLGVCQQTIRIGASVEVGDRILFHGWTGKPYRSKWSWRIRVYVTEAIPVHFNHEGVWLDRKRYEWRDRIICEIAARDYIAQCGQPLGLCLRDVIYGLSGKKLRMDGMYYGQIIRFKKQKDIEKYGKGV